MRTLVYAAGSGPGPLATFCAAKLQAGGVDVTLVAGGEHGRRLGEHGIRIRLPGGREELHRVRLTEGISPDDRYDLVLIFTPRPDVSRLLPTLAANPHVGTFLFLHNNSAGFREYSEALGAHRVMAGYMVVTAVDDGVEDGAPTIWISRNRAFASPIGELEGVTSGQIRAVAALLRRIDGLKIEVRGDMDAWLTSHNLSTLTYLGLYAADLDPDRYARTGGALRMGIRARAEAIRAQRAAGIPLSPPIFSILPLFPEAVAVWILRRVVATDFFRKGVVGISRDRREELTYAIEEYRDRIAPGGAPTPTVDRLIEHMRGERPPLPDGSDGWDL
ncbi:MAG: hypothetical protein EA422_06440 [Gemmatimonadales bacterium]|nr:MAG: hypothetical protein EA422_06440 [Gemmatimonadales bacterium]